MTIKPQKTDKQALHDWEDFCESIKASTPIDVNETAEDKKKRIKDLEKDPEKWFKYYFKKFSFAEPAPFHTASTRVVMKSPRLYQCRAWARGLAKSTRRMMEIFYLTYAKKFPTNMLLVSKNLDNAIRLLKPYRGNMAANQRLINDYGIQEKLGSWTEKEFTTRGRHTFRAVGTDQNPRGAKEDEIRVNIIVFDDVDDDEVCRNDERLDQVWNWIEGAVIPTVEISKPYYIFFDNNIIAEDSIMQRALKKATHKEVVNIRDENGVSSCQPHIVAAKPSEYLCVAYFFAAYMPVNFGFQSISTHHIPSAGTFQCVPHSFYFQPCVIVQVSGFVQYYQGGARALQHINGVFVYFLQRALGTYTQQGGYCLYQLPLGLVLRAVYIKHIFIVQHVVFRCCCFAYVRMVAEYTGYGHFLAILQLLCYELKYRCLYHMPVR